MTDERRQSDEESTCNGRFVILTHDHPFLHWDLMLEAGPVLRTWRLLEEPAPGHIIAAERLPDHRRHYLDYEGPVSRNRGTVTRWDQGQHQTTTTGDRTIARIQSDRLGNGQIVLTTTSDPERWSFTFTPDERDLPGT